MVLKKYIDSNEDFNGYAHYKQLDYCMSGSGLVKEMQLIVYADRISYTGFT